MSTLLGVFSDRDNSSAVLDRLSEHGIDREGVGLTWREKTVRRIEDVEVISYVDHFDGPGPEARKGALGGVIGGAAVGAGTVLLATTGIAIAPEVWSALGGGGGLAVGAGILAGAVGGFISGVLLGALLGAADHDATKVKTIETQIRESTEPDGFVLTIMIDQEQSEGVSIALREAGADEVSLIGGDDTAIRKNLN